MTGNRILPLLAATVGSWLIVASFARAADPPAARAALDPKIADLVALVSEGRVDAMLERIGPIPDREREAFDETRQHLTNIYSNAGKYSGFDVAGYKTITPRFQVAYVLVYFEKRPVLFQFGFYRVDDKWRPQTFHVETDFKTLLETMPLQR
jgi:hypothetical protein